MNLPEQTVMHALSIDWEALLPILFFLLYGLSQFFGSKKNKGAEEAEEAGAEEVDPMERARQIREEIQRKIRERREASGTETDPTMGQQPTVVPPYDPTQPERPTSSMEAEPVRTPVQRPQPRPVERAQPAASGGISIEERLRRQQERLQEARQRQAEARRKAQSMRQRVGAPSGPMMGQVQRARAATPVVDLVRPAVLREDVIKGLRDPNALRKAILYREILGQPKSLQSASQDAFPGS